MENEMDNLGLENQTEIMEEEDILLETESGAVEGIEETIPQETHVIIDNIVNLEEILTEINVKVESIESVVTKQTEPIMYANVDELTKTESLLYMIFLVMICSLVLRIVSAWHDWTRR